QHLTQPTIASLAAAALTPTRVRYWIVAMLFFATTVNYADRATLSIAGTALAKDLHLDAVAMGFVFSAFGWAYVIGQLPGGWLLDRFGSKKVYVLSLLTWSGFTFLQGFVGWFNAATAVVVLFGMRFLLGIAESPSFPGNSRIVASWFPTAERGTASAIFNSAQYFSLVLFSPIMGWITHALGWKYVFFFMGVVGMGLTFLFQKFVHGPKHDPRVNPAELEHIERGGALVNLDQKREVAAAKGGPKWAQIRELLSSRMLIGVYLGQYCITTLTYFFLTWFPVYLVQARGMSILKVGFVATLPALCGFFGGVLGGILSDGLLRRGSSLTVARKTPIVLGMLLSTSMIACNYVDAQWAVVVIMALAFFGKGIGALGWAVVSDTSPKQIAGLSGGLFNTFGNTAAITTPIIIGYLVKGSGHFNGALVFVGANAIAAILCYLLVVGEIKRLELKSA
ncbi:MAG: MFS transporter, partial [Anaeromyxobacteraceae bacterium]